MTRDCSPMDEWLRTYDVKYKKWLAGGLIDFSSKVVPVGESLESRQWVLPTRQAMDIIKNATVIALNACVCRTHYRRCDKPRDVCLLLDDYARLALEKGPARKIDVEEAEGILTQANREGLVHLSLYRPDHKLYALCSCCACCCHDLQLLLKHGRTGLTAQSEFLSRTDEKACVNCGLCVDRCVFGARFMDEGVMTYDPAKCYGCGLCLTTCPSKAITLEPRNNNSLVAPAPGSQEQLI
ncbi:MAG: 4Fe-4S dicluster domain-containing protein [Pseudomonadota bacterium]